MSNTECDRVKCVHNKMCNYLFELFDAQFTNVIDCNFYEEERPQGEWIKESNSKTTDIYRCSVCKRSIMLCKGADLTKYPFCHCGADMKRKEKKNENY